MTRIMVVGAYGESGKATIKALTREPTVEVLAAGRKEEELQRLRDLAPALDLARVDLNDAPSLRRLIEQTDIVINCAGPMRAVRDSIATAALAVGRHYVDPGGSQVLHQLLRPRHAEAAAKGIHLVVCSGWIAGVSEIFPFWVLEKARAQFDSIDELHAVSGDNNVWSASATDDVIDFVRRGNPWQTLGRRRHGRWHRQNFFGMWRSYDLPAPLATQRTFSRYNDEFACRADDLPYAEVRSCVALVSPRTVLTLGLIRALRGMSHEYASRLLNRARARDQRRFGRRSFVAAQITGRSASSMTTLSGAILCDDHYRATGTAAAVSALLIAAGKALKPGLAYVAEAFDPEHYIDKLAQFDFEPQLLLR
jgi:uncharacterized protein YbjT (DUF2867 family)